MSVYQIAYFLCSALTFSLLLNAFLIVAIALTAMPERRAEFALLWRGMKVILKERR